ncbi:hypothetical protein [Nocardia vaccinii]|uniref:hypothetical protein n=1 Tax=Nocardia vaccinii TaxID=1822 RepID=UPI0012F50D20|nr:hypothetical protein [Nocardia vaccinii]
MRDTVLYLLGLALGWASRGKPLISIEVNHRDRDQRSPSQSPGNPWCGRTFTDPTTHHNQ